MQTYTICLAEPTVNIRGHIIVASTGATRDPQARETHVHGTSKCTWNQVFVLQDRTQPASWEGDAHQKRTMARGHNNESSTYVNAQTSAHTHTRNCAHTCARTHEQLAAYMLSMEGCETLSRNRYCPFVCVVKINKKWHDMWPTERSLLELMHSNNCQEPK